MHVEAHSRGGKPYIVADVRQRVYRRKHSRVRYYPYSTTLALLFDRRHEKHGCLPYVLINSETGSKITEARFASEAEALVAMEEVARIQIDTHQIIRMWLI